MQQTSLYRSLGDIRLETIGYWTMFSLTVLALYLPPLRYLGYLVPFVAFYIGLADRRFRAQGINAPFLFLLVAGLIQAAFANLAGFKDMFFILSGISASLVLSRVTITPKLLLILFSIGTLIFSFAYGGLTGGFVYDFAKSASTFEGNFGFLFGLLAVYAFTKRRYWIFGLAFLGAALALKRIVLLAVLICCVVALLPERVSRKLLNPIVLLAVNLAIVLVLVLYANHYFDYWIYLATDQSADQLGQGRQKLYQTVTRDIFGDPLGYVFFGAGPGAAYDSLGRLFGIAGKSNLHSDILKIFYEYGLVAFSIFIWLGYRMRDIRIRIMFLYANILYATDNVLIYHFFLFFLCLFAISLEDDSATPGHANPSVTRGSLCTD